MSLLSALQSIAVRVRPMKAGALSLAIGLCAYVGIGLAYFDSGNDRWLIPAVLGILWCLSTLALIFLFQSVPARASDGDGVTRRIRGRVKRSGYWLLGLVWALSTLAVVVLTVRLGALWLSAAY